MTTTSNFDEWMRGVVHARGPNNTWVCWLVVGAYRGHKKLQPVVTCLLCLGRMDRFEAEVRDD